MHELSENEYEKLNEIAKRFVEDKSNNLEISYIDGIMEYCFKILTQQYYPVNQKNYSTNYTINEYINIIAKFLKSIDSTLETQFLNIISQVDENGKPFVHFINADKKYYEKYPEELTDSIKKELNNESRSSSEGIYIHIKNNLDDIFTIIHEVFHHINGIGIVESLDQKVEYTTYTNDFVTETVSIVSEKLLASYMLQQGFINENDYYVCLNRRLQSSKYCSVYAFLEIIFIKMHQSGIKINFFNYLDYGLYKLDRKYGRLITDLEKANDITRKVIKTMLEHNSFELHSNRRYIVAQTIANKVEYNKDGIKGFLELNKTAGSLIEGIPIHNFK